MSDRSSRLTFYYGLFFIVVLGTAARGWQIHESLWLDELHTAWVDSGSVADIGPRARIGNQGALYFYLVRMTTSLLGRYELAYRLPSLLAGIGLILATGVVTWRWTASTSAGWLAASLVAVDHNMIFFSQEARPYAVVQLVALLHVAAFYKLQTEPRWQLRLTVVSGWVLLFHLHYTTVLLLSGEMMWWAIIQWRQRGQGGYRPLHVACDLLLLGVIGAFSWQHLAEIATRRSMWEMFVFQHPPWVALRWFHWDLYVLPTLVSGLLLGLVIRNWRPAKEHTRGQELSPHNIAAGMLLLCWWATPVLLTWCLTTADVARLFFPRYLMAAAVAPMILAGVCLATFCRLGPARHAAAILTLVVALVGNGLVTQFWRDGRLITDRRQDWRAAVVWLNAQRGDTSPVLVRSGLIEADQLADPPAGLLAEYCLLPVNNLYAIKPPAALFPLRTSHSGRLTESAIKLLENQRGGWLVLNARRSTHEAIRRELRGSLPATELRFLHQEAFGNVAVWQIELRDPATPP